MHVLKSIAVFCGSNLGNDPMFATMATLLGKYLAEHQIKLIFGGGNIGLMGVISQAVLQHHGEVLGVIPQFLVEAEKSYRDEIEMLIVADMATRKDKMIELAHGFIVLPGGVGTYEEVFEVLSRLQLKQIKKPIGFLNINHFFDIFIDLMKQIAQAKLMPNENLNLFCTDDNFVALIEKMRRIEFLPFDKWHL